MQKKILKNTFERIRQVVVVRIVFFV